MHRSAEGNQLWLISKCSSLLPTCSKVNIIKGVIQSDSDNYVGNNQLSPHIPTEGCLDRFQFFWRVKKIKWINKSDEAITTGGGFRLSRCGKKMGETSPILWLCLRHRWSKQVAGTPSWMTAAQLLPWRLPKCSFTFRGGVRQTQIPGHFGGRHFTSCCEKTICAISRGSSALSVLCASFSPNVLALYSFPEGWPWAKLSARHIFPWIFTSSCRQLGTTVL